MARKRKRKQIEAWRSVKPLPPIEAWRTVKPLPPEALEDEDFPPLRSVGPGVMATPGLDVRDITEDELLALVRRGGTGESRSLTTPEEKARRLLRTTGPTGGDVAYRGIGGGGVRGRTGVMSKLGRKQLIDYLERMDEYKAQQGVREMYGVGPPRGPKWLDASEAAEIMMSSAGRRGRR